MDGGERDAPGILQRDPFIHAFARHHIHGERAVRQSRARGEVL
jgi:hypothetical protein